MERKKERLVYIEIVCLLLVFGNSFEFHTQSKHINIDDYGYDDDDDDYDTTQNHDNWSNLTCLSFHIFVRDKHLSGRRCRVDDDGNEDGKRRRTSCCVGINSLPQLYTHRNKLIPKEWEVGFPLLWIGCNFLIQSIHSLCINLSYRHFLQWTWARTWLPHHIYLTFFFSVLRQTELRWVRRRWFKKSKNDGKMDVDETRKARTEEKEKTTSNPYERIGEEKQVGGKHRCAVCTYDILKSGNQTINLAFYLSIHRMWAYVCLLLFFFSSQILFHFLALGFALMAHTHINA